MDTSNKGRSIISALLVLLVIVGGYFWFTRGDRGGKDAEDIIYTSAEGVDTEMVDLKSGTGSRLPAGFPEGVPVEINNLKESYKQVYNEQGVTLYAVSYTSTKSVAELWDDYRRYLGDQEYVVDQTSDRAKGYLRGQKGNDEVSVQISTVNGASYVQLGVIERNNE